MKNAARRVNHYSLLHLLLLLLLYLQSVLGWPWSDLLRSAREADFDQDLTNGSNETNSSTTTTADLTTTSEPITTTTDAPDPPTPILTADAITNIVVSVLAVILLTGLLCYLMITFNQVEHRTRVRTALERNKQIDRQIAASRARQQQKQSLREQRVVHTQEQDVLKVETVAMGVGVGVAEESKSLKTPIHTAELEAEAAGELGSGEHEARVISQERVVTSTELEKSLDSPKVIDGREQRGAGRGVERVVDFADKVSGSSSAEDDDRPLISVTNSEGAVQPVLLVQPAQPEELV